MSKPNVNVSQRFPTNLISDKSLLVEQLLNPCRHRWVEQTSLSPLHTVVDMSRYDDIQGIVHDGYATDYAMCSVMRPNWDETKLGVKSTSNNHVFQESFEQPHTFQMMQPHSFAIQVYATTFLSVYIEDELSARHVPWMQKISFMALIDAMAATMFIAALKTWDIF
ncbi:unnamed protein product [Angiostrongylus costaricensis]|uniref:3'-5' exonuclease domain-containing protein n=1 Tax=Angiostrongylus costaricensis TaxID=334426 RepID=A0A0R3PFA6_ANGCS|nr:unnamed protein product [Angiostrongylus costaricensis]